MARDDVLAWLAGYERLFRTAGTGGLAELFTEDVSHVVSPWTPPLQGLTRCRSCGSRCGTAPEEQFTIAYDLVALDGTTAVVRVAVDYADGQRWRDMWVLRFAYGRVAHFEGWPFAPGQEDGHHEAVVEALRP